jgi:hypothetical protein
LQRAIRDRLSQQGDLAAVIGPVLHDTVEQHVNRVFELADLASSASSLRLRTSADRARWLSLSRSSACCHSAGRAARWAANPRPATGRARRLPLMRAREISAQVVTCSTSSQTLCAPSIGRAAA